MTLISFIVSFIVLISLIILKVIENKFGGISFLNRIFAKGDYFIGNLFQGLYLRYNYLKRVTHIFFFDFLPSLLYAFLIKSKDYVARRYYNSSNEFRGRRLLRADGSVSNFLERLSEDK